jgi:hypothetical protein
VSRDLRLSRRVWCPLLLQPQLEVGGKEKVSFSAAQHGVGQERRIYRNEIDQTLVALLELTPNKSSDTECDQEMTAVS